MICRRPSPSIAAARRCSGRRAEQVLRRRASSGARPARGLARAVAGRDAGPGRRIGERQDHPRAPPARASSRRIRAESSNWTERRSAARAAGVEPGERKSLQIVFQNPDSALNRSHSIRRLIGRVSRGWARRERERRGAAAAKSTRSVRLDDHYFESTCPAAIGRIEAAGCDRASLCGRAPHRGLRRTDLCARRIGPGGDPESVGRAAGEASSQLPVHLPRLGYGALSIGSNRGALPRPADGDRTGRAGVCGPHHPYTAALLSARPRAWASGRLRGFACRARSRARSAYRTAASSTRAVRANSGAFARRRSRRSIPAPSRATRSVAIFPARSRQRATDCCDAGSGDAA